MSNYLLVFITLLICQSCISNYVPDRINSQVGLLVVDGTITNDTTFIRLSRSVGMYEDMKNVEAIKNAVLCIESSDGVFKKETQYKGNGVYAITTGDLKPSNQYRLNITIDGNDYQSEYLSPLITPEIDSVSFQTKGEGQSVFVTVSTHDPQDQSHYYRWTYKEIWEFKTQLYAEYAYINKEWIFTDLMSSNNHYYCWASDSSKEFFIGTTEKLSQNVVSHKNLIEIDPRDEKISILYHIAVTQQQIRKEAYDYYTNLQKNIEQTGSLFSHIPAEMEGNVKCISDSKMRTVGYVEVSITTSVKQFRHELFYRSSY